MARQLTQTVQDQITNKRIGKIFVFEINDVDFTADIIDWSISYNRQFGSAAATFTLDNGDGKFSSGGANEIKVGDIIELIENYEDDVSNFKSFYGKVEQRALAKSNIARTITISCLDYISILQHWDIDLELEGTKIKVENEVLQPQFLSAPNDMYAHIFNFANDALATNPLPILTIRDKNHLTEDPQYDGFDLYYANGQVKVGAPINARDNYDLVARVYYFYTVGLYVEDVLETLLTESDGYGNYLFGETSAQSVIDNHLTTTFNAEEGTTTDYLTPNYTTSTITIKHQLSAPVSARDTVVNLDSVAGIPTSGTGEINGDIFTWTGIAGTQLTGVPSSGSNSLSAHPTGAYFKYEADYPSGQVWYLTYSNLITDLVAGNFTVPGATVAYVDKRVGRIILNTNINLTSVVTCNVDYSFKTLQTAGVEINSISFRPREVENRFKAIEKLRQYCPPNYIIRTQGDNKIWASLLSQKTTADYTLDLIQGINYLEDEDLYTRVLFYRKNKNPTNLMFGDGVDFVTTGESYKAIATQTVLQFVETVEGWHKFTTLISNAGYIELDTITPIVYINGVPIDNTLHSMIAQPVKYELTTRTETTTTSDKEGTDVEVRNYYFYKIYFAHQSIEPSQSIYLYDAIGNNVMTISPNDPHMDYGRGIYYAPGDSQNSTIESVSTATYFVLYATRSLEIDYDNVVFKINSTLLPNPSEAEVSATFEYFTVFTPASGIGAIIDGRWDTQVQTEFFAQPPSGYNYAILDLGGIKEVQAIDVIAGFYKPDEYRKFDIDVRFTLQYSLDNVTYYEIGDKTHNFKLSGGESAKFEESDLGVNFRTRYFKVILENVKKIDYRNGVYPVAVTEVAMYDDIILKSEATLISTTTLTVAVGPGDDHIHVESTEGFTDPGSGETATAYISGLPYKQFTYTGLTATTFIGVTLISGCSGAIGNRVSQTIEDDTTLYDDTGLKSTLGDRVYKDVSISDDALFTQTQLDDLAKYYLKEFVKNHSKLEVSVLYAPYLKVGQTISLTDSYNNITNERYFIEAVANRSNSVYSLTLAKYPE